MKTFKLILPTIGLSMLTPMTTTLVSCNKGGNEPEPVNPLCLTNVDSEASANIGYTISGSLPDIRIYCKLDDEGVWRNWDGSAQTIEVGHKLYIKNNCNSLSKSFTNYFSFSTNGGELEATGNIDSMINYSGLSDYCFYKLFFQCANLKNMPELPDEILSKCCYCQMFRECTSLSQVTSLGATTLAEGCYNSMFYKCASLTQAPDLLATELAKDCYNDMFYECTSLKTVQETLPAETLKTNCYHGMFMYCGSLEKAPKLPATVLADHCYAEMFKYCYNLKTAPSLPATTLSPSCYESMFYTCHSLTTAPNLPAKLLADQCYSGMFVFCESLKVSQNEGLEEKIICDFTEVDLSPIHCVNGMFSYTGGSFKGEPTEGNIYYYN